jgi:hypothetical protein
MTLRPVTADAGTIRPVEPRGGPATSAAMPEAAPRAVGPATSVGMPEATPRAVDAAVSGDVPPGADPQAWLGLTIEERSYFAGLANEGRLSYGPLDRAGESPLFRGRYLSIRV